MLISLLTALPATAQFSGGGWVAYQNPNAPPFVPDSAWDWTGFTLTRTQVSANGTSTGGTSNSYASFFTLGDNVGGNTYQIRTYAVSGSSTYKWIWTPTGSNKGAPPPSLYVLAQAYGGACLRPNNTGQKGLTGNATFNFSSSVPVYNFGPLVTATQYKVLSAAGGTTSSVSVDPTFSANMYGATPSGDVGYCTVNYGNSVYPIVLSRPDPMGRPDLGDGINQYTYGNERPNGQLTVPASVYVPGSSDPDVTWLLPHVTLTVSPAMQTGAQPFVWTTAGSNMQVNTTVRRPSYVNPWPAGQFCYVGLPPDNSYFGNHVMTMKVDGNVSQTANYQLFYAGTASNWPNADGITPNWYYYYQQLAPFAISYNPDLGSLGYLGFCLSTFLINHDTKVAVYTGSILTLGPGATKSLSVPVFEVGPNGFIRVAGKVKTKGIISYLFVSGHESGHEAAAFQGVEVSYIDGVPPNGVKDSDGDGIPDVWEIAHHLDPENPDTGGFYTATGGLDDGKGDRESLATMVGLGRVTKYSGLWQQDWADLGIQYGKRSSYVPFEYDSLDLSQIPSNKIPATVLTDWP